MAIIGGTGEDDRINGTNQADTIDAVAGDDRINSGTGDDIVNGGAGDDQINAGAGDDRLIGGAGDDTLNGAGGSDTYVFNFNVQASTTVSFTEWTSGSTVFELIGSQYTNWLQSVGSDLDGDGVVSYQWSPLFQSQDPLTYLEGATTNDPTVEYVILIYGGPIPLTVFYEDTVTIGGASPSITASDGRDTIMQFQTSGPNADKIEMHGITRPQAESLFTYGVGDFDNDGAADDSRVSWEGSTDDADGSITVMGSTYANLSAFLDVVVFT